MGGMLSTRGWLFSATVRRGSPPQRRPSRRTAPAGSLVTRCLKMCRIMRVAVRTIRAESPAGPMFRPSRLGRKGISRKTSMTEMTISSTIQNSCGRSTLPPVVMDSLFTRDL